MTTTRIEWHSWLGESLRHAARLTPFDEAAESVRAYESTIRPQFQCLHERWDETAAARACLSCRRVIPRGGEP